MNISSIVSGTVREIFYKIDDVRKKRDISWAKLVRQLRSMGVDCSVNAPYDWKAGRSNSFLNCMPEIAKVLEVPEEKLMINPINYVVKSVSNSINESPNSTLQIEQKSETTMSKQTLELARIFDGLSAENQYKLMGFAFKLRDEK